MSNIVNNPKRRWSDKLDSRWRMKFLAVFAAGTVVLGFAIMGTLLFWALYPYPTITLSKQPFKVLNRTVRHGDNVLYVVGYIKQTDVIPTQYKQFVDGLVYSISPEQSRPTIISPGKGTALVSIHVPKGLPPGVYFIHTDTYYVMNPIRTIHEQSRTETFTVTR